MVHLANGTMSCRNKRCGHRQVNVTLAWQKRLAHLMCPQCGEAWTMTLVDFENEAHGFNYGASQ